MPLLTRITVAVSTTSREGRRHPAPMPSRQRPSVKTLLAGLEREQLQALLLHLIEQQPALADVVEAQVHRVRMQPLLRVLQGEITLIPRLEALQR